MCGYFRIGFINYMFKGKRLTDVANRFHQITLKIMMI